MADGSQEETKLVRKPVTPEQIQETEKDMDRSPTKTERQHPLVSDVSVQDTVDTSEVNDSKVKERNPIAPDILEIV